ncbi:MAG: UDP-3-O-(3-hydroxymyristoyl)glucosamine N-acyltransferase [Bdellovibrionota bacterium]
MISKTYEIQELADRVGAQIIGDRDKKVSAIMPLESAGPSDLSFFSPKSKRSHNEMMLLARSTKAAAVLVKEYEQSIPCTQLCVSNPMGAVIALSELFAPDASPAVGIHPQAAVSASARLGKNVSVGPFAVVGDDVVIGDDSVVHPHAVIYRGATIGKRCVIHSGAVIRENVRMGDDCLIQNGVVLGGDGFGYVPDKVLGHRRIPHIGTLVLGDRVDIGANATIDRAMLGESRVGTATKIDNLVMVGHNCVIGERSLLCGMVGVSGSCTIGDDVILAGNVGVADHLTVGNKVRAAAKAGIATNIPPGIDVAGHPAVPAAQWRRQFTALKRLPELFRTVRDLKKSLGIANAEELSEVSGEAAAESIE